MGHDEPVMRATLRLRPLRPQDEKAARAAHEALARDAFDFLLGYSAGDDWAGYLERLSDQSRGLNLAPDRVPATFLAATDDDVLVGRISIRHSLNEYLASYGGHIGYGVVPEHRRCGYASEILRQGLIIARSLGVERVLVTCDDDNVGSARVIEKNGGILDAVVEEPNRKVPLRRYWIP